MSRCVIAAGLFLHLSVVGLIAADNSEPTIEEVFAVCLQNRERLNPLHVQYVYQPEWTEASRGSYRKQAEVLEHVLKQVDEGKSIEEVVSSESQIGIEQIRQQAEFARSMADHKGVSNTYEIFIDGADYQVRSPRSGSLKEGEKWTFPDVPLTPVSLTQEYAPLRIYSRSTQMQPAAKIWPGQPRPDYRVHPMITEQTICETSSLNLPPFVDSLTPQWDARHPIDTFFSGSIEDYQVIGQEERDGRQLTIVDVSLGTGRYNGSLEEDGTIKQQEIRHYYRGWLDLERGGIPQVIHMWHEWPELNAETISRWSPYRIITTTEVMELGNGGFYPAVTVEEQFNIDPNVPNPTAEEWAEVRAGKRKVPQVVYERQTWSCTTVETDFPHEQDFFVIEFPEGLPLYDLDAEKTVGALETQPVVTAGQLAPELSVSRWLDGKQRTLDELRGQVVVVEFWGLWCSACRNNVPAMTMLQEKYAGQPVTFVSIHTADHDIEKLADRIANYTQDQNWQFVAGIDEGTMIENSVTAHAYGVRGYPTHVIIGPNGVVLSHGDEPAEGMEDITGKTCDELTPEDERRIEAYQKARFEAAGESWPLPDDITQAELVEILSRINVRLFSQEIDSALETLNKTAE